MSSAGRPPGLTLANWDLGGPVSAWSYRHTCDLFPVRRLRPGRRSTMTAADQMGRRLLRDSPALRAELDTGLVSALSVSAGGRMIMSWPDGSRAEHLLMSVSKVFASLTVGLLEGRGLISYDASIRDYLPELDAAWQSCTVQQVLDQTSGVDCPEVGDPGAYRDPEHPFYRFEASLGWRPSRQSPSPYELVLGYSRGGEPGSRYEYTSVNTFLLAWLIERVTGTSYPDALQELIFDELALEADAAICVNDAGVAVSHGGLIMSADDLARFGSVFTPASAAVGHRLELPASYSRMLAGSSARMRRAVGSEPTPGAQWNVVHADGDMFKSGFGGQGLYVSPANDVVIAFVGVPDVDGRANGLVRLCRDLVPAIRRLPE